MAGIDHGQATGAGHTPRRWFSTLLSGMVLLTGLYLISRENYLLFHSLVELFSVIISITIFVLVWSARNFIDNRYLLVLGIASLFVGLLDLVHALAYSGIGVFPATALGQPNAANLATQLWIAARYLHSTSLVAAPLALIYGRQVKIRPALVLAAYALVTTLLLVSINQGVFPASLLDDTGLTSFKIASEYAIMLIFATGLLLLLDVRAVSESFDRNVRNLLALSIAFNIVAEIAFTGYLVETDPINLFGHFVKVGAVYLTYEAIIVTGLLRPYSLLFRELAQREEALRASEAREKARAAQMETVNAALHESEQRYRSLFESMAEGFGLFELLYDENGQAVDYLCHEVNPAFERVIGITREQFVGKTRREIIQDRDYPGKVTEWLEYFASAVESGEPVHIEEYIHPVKKHLDVLISPIWGRFFSTVIIDMTERRQSQEALRQSEARLRRLVDSNIIGIIYSRGGNEVTMANDALLEIIGYTREEFESGQIDWEKLSPIEYVEIDQAAMAEVIDRGACTPYEKEFIRKDGSRKPVLVGYSYFAADTLAPYVGFILDLSSQKRAEESVRQYAAQLERSNRELQDFAFVASHDMQEPLRKIQAFGERLKERMAGQLDESTGDYLERMLNAAARMRAMINDLLSLSRVTTQGQPFQRVSLEEIAKGVLSDLETRIERTGGRVVLGDLPEIEADPLQIHQLLLNLVSNALKFQNPNQTPRVQLYAESTKDNQQVVLCIEDNGIGFEEQYLERIFQPFQRLHGMSQYEGSGMGLAICRKIVERHSGNITARSAPGEGTTFIITLPARQAQQGNLP